jgi:ubiquinone/menaquinone biosynthesis C-methylase UbiE
MSTPVEYTRNIPRLIYRIGVWIASRLGLYAERAEKYFNRFKDHVKNGITVLDTGCGSGAFSKLLSKQDCCVVSLDVSSHVLKSVPEVQNIHKICGDAQNLPLRDSSVDVVIAISLLEHLSRPYSAMREIRRVLKTGGFFVVQLPNLQYFIEPHTKFPLLFLLPASLKRVISEQLDYYINFHMTVKGVLRLATSLFTLRKKDALYHKFKTCPWPPAWIFIFQK